MNVSRLLGDVMGGIVAGDSGIELVSGVSTQDMLDAIDAHNPNVVVLGSEAGAIDAHLALIAANHPTLRVISVDVDGRSATIYEPGAVERRVTDISSRMMLSLIRGSVG
ncbi:MAG TPA: hypothetical protein VGM72_07545 [Micropepsaceae bacterium]